MLGDAAFERKPIATTTSDPDGHFVFDKLAAGDYVLGFICVVSRRRSVQ